MRTAWAWPIAESLHFLGLCLLIGCDRHVRSAAARRGETRPDRRRCTASSPGALLGFAINVSSGLMFLLTEPDQYIYNPSFHFKLLFMTIAGLNAGDVLPHVLSAGLRHERRSIAPRRAKVIAAISLSAWVSVIICGRLLTFYRPAPVPWSAEFAAADVCACPGKRSQTMTRIILALTVAAALCTGVSLSAHHSYSAYRARSHRRSARCPRGVRMGGAALTAEGQG